jgi:hypothetical protein
MTRRVAQPSVHPDTRALAERWNGSQWSIIPTIAPNGSALLAVSCTSGTACTAVGYQPGRRLFRLPLVERWNGSRWSIQRIALPKLLLHERPPGGTNQLGAVSCGSGTA